MLATRPPARPPRIPAIRETRLAHEALVPRYKSRAASLALAMFPRPPPLSLPSSSPSLPGPSRHAWSSLSRAAAAERLLHRPFAARSRSASVRSDSVRTSLRARWSPVLAETAHDRSSHLPDVPAHPALLCRSTRASRATTCAATTPLRRCFATASASAAQRSVIKPPARTPPPRRARLHPRRSSNLTDVHAHDANPRPSTSSPAPRSSPLRMLDTNTLPCSCWSAEAHLRRSGSGYRTPTSTHWISIAWLPGCAASTRTASSRGRVDKLQRPHRANPRRRLHHPGTRLRHQATSTSPTPTHVRHGRASGLMRATQQRRRPPRQAPAQVPGEQHLLPRLRLPDLLEWPWRSTPGGA